MMNAFWKQTWEAAMWTFLQAFFAAFAVSGVSTGDWTELANVAGVAGLAGLAAVASFVKSLIVRNIGEPNSTLLSG